MIATAMSANVFFWIIPGQRTVVADLKAGRPVDPIHGKRGKQRSVHNTYFTLPVLFAMLSNHYSFTWSHPQNWLVLILMMAAGAAIRQFFVMRHGYKLGAMPTPGRTRWWAWPCCWPWWPGCGPCLHREMLFKNIAIGAQSTGAGAHLIPRNCRPCCNSAVCSATVPRCR
jgi:hypothetical protein